MSWFVKDYVEIGRRYERERIIALLEANICNAYGEDCSDNPNCSARNSLIALIKGEEE